MIDNNNKKIDELLNIRNKGMYDYSRSTAELIKFGVKIGKNISGNLTIPNSFEQYLKNYNRSNMEFEWEVQYNDKSILKQYEENKVNTYREINQSKIKSISFISNFTWPTDNVEKRVIVRLNWKTGLFELMNGFVDQKVKTHLCINPIPDRNKLILFTRKRFSSTVGDFDTKYKEFALPTEEFFYYNRFILGYEAKNKQKKMCIIEPNGIIKIFEN